MLLVIRALHHLVALPIKENGACIVKARLNTEARDGFPQAPVHFQLPITGALLTELLALGVSLFTIGCGKPAAVDVEVVQVEQKDMPI
jgi:hypothetical protein